MIPACQPLSITVKNMTNTVCLNTEDFSTRKNGASDSRRRGHKQQGFCNKEGLEMANLQEQLWRWLSALKWFRWTGHKKGTTGRLSGKRWYRWGHHRCNKSKWWLKSAKWRLEEVPWVTIKMKWIWMLYSKHICSCVCVREREEKMCRR